MLIFTTTQVLVSQVSSLLIKVSMVSDFALNFKDWTAFWNLPEENLTRLTVNEKSLELVDISFKYPGTDDFVLQGINICIKENEKIAIVGENGSGKSTLINLIMGIYSPTTGSIWVGEKKLTSVLYDFRKKPYVFYKNLINIKCRF